MTREEAIKLLKVVDKQLDITDQYGDGVDLEPYNEAIDMAIAALSEQVTGKLKNPCNSLLTDDLDGYKEHKSKLDLISRQDAIDIANSDGAYGYISADELAKMPSARPTGEWIPFCVLPESEQGILISSPRWGVYKDIFFNDEMDGCGLYSGEDIEDDMAWMPLPEPYKGGENE